MISERDLATEQLLKRGLQSRSSPSFALRRLKFLNPSAFLTIDSTQEYLKGMRTLHEGDFVLSRRQTEGRGRQGRKWFSDEGGLWLSLVLEPDRPSVLDGLALAGARSILQTFEGTGFALRGGSIKLPNDVLFEGRKIAGVLVDAEIREDKSIAFLGVGVNLNNDPTTNPEIGALATSYRNLTGREANISEFAILFLRAFDTIYAELCQI